MMHGLGSIGRLSAFALSIGATAFTTGAFAAADEFTPEAIQFFEAKVRPVLVEHCHSCHSHDAKKLKANLFLDSRKGLLTSGDSDDILVPGHPEKSLLIESISYKNVDLQMPPKNKLSDQQIADLTQWVKMGAPWPVEAAKTGTIEAFDLEKRKKEAWAFQPIKAQPLPVVKDQAWAKTPIDSFILAKLEAKNIKPSAPADPRALIRRVYFDLIGLPPSAEQVEAFVKDSSPQAYAKVVDSLLASPQFGEKWARHWLDLVRFAETCGHEFDYPLPHAWRYRDYVIRALNDDLPYDQFAVEHIAGDLLKNPRRNPSDQTNESIIATGFWHLHEAVHAPVDVRLDEAIRVDNQIDVFSKTFLGLTVACARCHDHKFDPISTKDFYALAGFLQSSRRQEALLDPFHKIETAAKQILAERSKGDAALIASVNQQGKTAADETARYLLAVREVLSGTPKKTGKQAKDEIVFEDFEAGDYRNWTATGTAFGLVPQTQKTIGSYQGDVGAQGKWFVNSHNIRSKAGDDVVKGDAHEGTLTSKAFTIEHRFITFLIGGGSHKDKTCVNLVVDGKVVRTAVGPNDNRMIPASFDVSDLQGKQAQIQLVDQHTGGWGNIGFDHVVFTNSAKGAPESAPSLAIEEVATDRQLDAAKLARWVEAVQSEKAKSPAHPLYVWQRLAKFKGDDAQLKSLLAAIGNDVAQAKSRAEETAKSSPVFADFNGSNFGDWFVTGDAFRTSPTQAQQWDATSDQPRLIESGIAHSGLSSGKLRGVLRSPTFTITSPQIHYRVSAKGAQIRLVIDGFVMDVYNALLFRGMSFGVDTKGEWVWRTQGNDLDNYIGHRAHIEIIDDGDGFIAVDEIRFGNGPVHTQMPAEFVSDLLDDEKPSLEKIAAKYGAQFGDAATAWSTGKLTSDQTSLMQIAVDHALLLKDETTREQLHSTLGDSRKNIEQISRTIPDPIKVQAMADGSGENEHVFIRGSHKNLGDEVDRRLLEAIAANQKPIAQGSGRLELAQRVVDPANPFFSRVIVNRLWHHLFGRGIVPTVDDFGYMGLPPSHPELLDWMASDFVKQGWSIKRALRQMVMSSVYQQSSRIDMHDERAKADPTNELLYRSPIRRLQAEAIRDAILSVSGRLDRTVGGPSVPVHVTPFMEGRGRPGSGPLDGNGRRSLYTEIRRNFLPPMMLAFDFPSPFSTMGRRTVSNVPAQALILMNDPFVTEQAKRWAQNELTAGGDAAARLERMFITALGRPINKTELAAMQQFIAQQAKQYGAGEDDRRVWADVAHVIFNMKEFVFLD